MNVLYTIQLYYTILYAAFPFSGGSSRNGAASQPKIQDRPPHSHHEVQSGGEGKGIQGALRKERLNGQRGSLGAGGGFPEGA